MFSQVKQKKDSLYVIFIFLLPFIFFLPLFLGQRAFLGQDVTLQNLPLRAYIAQQFKLGRFPLWAPEILSGFPIFAETQGGVLYPLNLIFLFLPAWYAYNLSFILHLSLAGVFFYLFVRLFVNHLFSCFLSSICFMFSGFFLMYASHINEINVFVWAPLALYTWELYIKQKHPVFVVLCAFILSISFFAGHPPSTLRILMLFSCYGVFRSIVLRRIILILPLGISLIVFLVFSSVQLYPLAELVQYSIRSRELPWDIASKSPISLLSIYTAFVHLGPFGHKSTLYLGIIPFGFAMYALLKSQNKDNWFWGGFALITFLLSLGGNGPLWYFLRSLPMLSRLRAPEEFIFLTVFSTNILFAAGYALFAEKRKEQKYRYVHLGILLFLFLDLFPWNFYFQEKLVENQVEKPIPGYIFNKRVDNLLDFYIVPSSVYTSVPEFIRFLQKDKSLYRISNVSGPLWQSSGMPYGISSIEGTTPLRLSCYVNMLTWGYKYDKIRTLLNVKYFLVRFPVKSKNLKLVYSAPGYQIYRIKNLVPRILLVDYFRVIDDDEEALLTMLGDLFNPNTKVILNIFPGVTNRGEESNISNDNIRLISYEPHKIKISASLKKPGILVMMDTYYPGWKAYVDNKPKKIYKANLCFRAVPLEAGKHDVVFRFESKSFKLGAIITCGSLALCFGLLLLLVIIKKKKI